MKLVILFVLLSTQISILDLQPNYEHMEEQRFRQQETRGKHKKGMTPARSHFELLF